MPDLSLFEVQARRKAAHDAGPGKYYVLHYRTRVTLAQPWQNFISEVQGGGYDYFIERMLGRRAWNRITLRIEWRYIGRGGREPPHCDFPNKVAEHIFSFNTEADWEANWGGEVLLLDDTGQFNAHAAPAFEDLKITGRFGPRGNGSLLLMPTEHSWHGMQPLQCPPGKLLKTFIVTVMARHLTLWQWWRRLRGYLN